MTATKSVPAMTTPEERAADLRDAEAALTAAGISLYEAGQSGEFARIVLGAAGFIPGIAGNPGQFPFVLRLSGGSAATDSMAAARDRSHLGKLMARISKGWTDTSVLGDQQFMLSLSVDSAVDGAIALAGLAAKRAEGPKNRILASLRTTKSAVAPSRVSGVEWTHTAGVFAQFTRITVSELAGIGVMLDEASLVKDPRSLLAYDIRTEGSMRANAIRDSFNRGATTERIIEAFEKAGWLIGQPLEGGRVPIVPRGGDVSVGYSVAVGGGNFPCDSVVVGTHAADATEDAIARAISTSGGLQMDRIYRGFDAINFLEHGPDSEDGVGVEACAEALLEAGEATIATVILRAGEKVYIDIADETDSIVIQYVDAIANARCAWDESLPLAMQLDANGLGLLTGVISMTPTGTIHHWNGDIDGLMAAAAQLCSYYKDPELGIGGQKRINTVMHTIPESIRKQVAFKLMERALPIVSYVGAGEPVLTPTGVVWHHGFDRKRKALVAIPERDRAAFNQAFANFPECPTQEQAQASFERLQLELLSDFCFESDGDMARAFGLLIGGLSRRLITSIPFYAATAGQVASGKSAILAMIRMLCQGNVSATRWRGGKHEEEDTKAETAAVLCGNGVAWMHNDEAGAVITSDMVTRSVTSVDNEQAGRILNVSATTKLFGQIFTAASNFTEVAGELPRRTRWLRLAYLGAGRAVDRKIWRHTDLQAYVRTERPNLLRDAFVVLTFGLLNYTADVAAATGTGGFSSNWGQVVLGSLHHITWNGVDLATLHEDGNAATMASDRLSDVWAGMASNLWEPERGGADDGFGHSPLGYQGLFRVPAAVCPCQHRSRCLEDHGPLVDQCPQEAARGGLFDRRCRLQDGGHRTDEGPGHDVPVAQGIGGGPGDQADEAGRREARRNRGPGPRIHSAGFLMVIAKIRSTADTFEVRPWLRKALSPTIGLAVSTAGVLTIATGDGTGWSVDLRNTEAATAICTALGGSGRLAWAERGTRSALVIARALDVPVARLDWICCLEVLSAVLEPKTKLKSASVEDDVDAEPAVATNRLRSALAIARDVERMEGVHPLAARQLAKRSVRVDRMFRPAQERGWELDLDLVNAELLRTGAERARMEADAGLDLLRDNPATHAWLAKNHIHLTDKDGKPSLSRFDFKRAVVEPGHEAAWTTYRAARSLKGSIGVLKAAARTNVDGVVRTDIHVHGAATGRMTTTGSESFQMNLLNVPKKIRGILQAPEGMVLVSLDYSAAEIHIAASLSNERGLIALLAAGVDPYMWLGVKSFGQTAMDSDPEMRGRLKTTMISTIYGIGTASLSAALNVDRTAAQGLIDALRAEWPRLFQFIESATQASSSGVPAYSASGRPIPAITDGRHFTRMNHLCQSAGADYLYMGITKVAEVLGADAIWLAVHDEIVICVAPAEAENAARILKVCMTFDLPNGVTLTGVASIGGRSWAK
ncbi:hypothetical protein KIV56_04540 [Cryobacterium breve]|uniref:DNA-directed DNA polymerase n=1 Tax=Cryobacterium breve TaxID=1259258 RepID=A0ABY7NDU2_9MICO|nr:DNA polymerase [Cryobacterium breve]WBM80671.1 hypothetical protein KIV56_04540 [Cryobacterium breve]